MKNLALLTLLCVVMFAACKKKDRITAPAPGPVSLTADFQAHFVNTRVHYFVDDWQVFDGTITTRPDIGLAHSHHSGLQPGIHRIRVSVDGQHSKDTVIDLAGTLYLGVNYNAGEIRFMLSERRWAYD